MDLGKGRVVSTRTATVVGGAMKGLPSRKRGGRDQGGEIGVGEEDRVILIDCRKRRGKAERKELYAR